MVARKIKENQEKVEEMEQDVEVICTISKDNNISN